MNDLQAFLEDLARGLPMIVDQVSMATMEVTESNMKQRIFEEGRATDGSQLKQGRPYAPMTVGIRKKAGRQTNKIDLQFTGETLRGINTVKSTFGADIIFNNSKNASKIDDVEKMWRQEITNPTNEEANETIEYFQKLFNTTIDELGKRHNISV